MKNYPHIAQKLYNEPWLITKEKHESLAALFEAHIRGDKTLFDSEDDDQEDGSAIVRQVGQTLIIPVHGVLGKHLSQLEMLCGGCSVDAIGQELDKAESAYGVANVLLDFRSPGGTVSGIPELARKISNFSKDITAFTDVDCCSGALWLASQADSFYCTESAMTGSCGAYSIYLDRSRQLEEAGIVVNAISSGEFKLAGSSFKPMTDAERAMLQGQMDDIHDKFKAAVNSKRSVEAQYLQGQVFYGDEAAEIGMVDGIVEDMQEVLDNLMG